MSPEEVDAFLTAERTCRVATSSPTGPHLTPLWFVWDGTALWVSSLVKSQRWTDIERDPQAAVLVDGGHEFRELHGVELRGRFESVGEIPRTGIPEPALETVELLHARKYTGRDEKHYDGRHGWLRLVPEKITSWDFRKM
ncbi:MULTISPECIES: pyridoxamine 5'-phosphate oxidase family protein [unclassified Pseudofrankia]|uniref:pyridoxamine 5'-phosphate oxidase family protein n=1 Tax=unclassified Pseudofrankia TaxID=2994372 RepID=UPI0008D9BA24|nr:MULTISPECIES: pyridoxamine 5'-phosphate oxidase family protein [unclassified Pseudofrankia]MDT3445428.1 pyridoxamine 5'-phosphate oxidase family protein [Pseudofrankia sp. BMG5.37]OHV67065.1 pyridoxamine 5-phosphate oxidase [Pseudofrankia sp. BMG5.36]